MKQIIVFDTDLNGHHLEYLNHIYMEASRKSNNYYIFVIPLEFKNLQSNLDWPLSPHIKFDFLNKDEITNCETENLLKSSYFKSILLKKKIKEHAADHVFLIMLMQFLPFLPFVLMNTKVKISGIIYLIYLYRWKNASFVSKTSDAFKYILLSKSKLFNKIFILNDKSAATYLNKIYNTHKYKFLPDPFVFQQTPIAHKDVPLNIDTESMVFLHFGALTSRKGTMEILEAITKMDVSMNDKPICIIFAGKVLKDIKIEFYQKIKELNNKIQLIIYDEFCSYEMIGLLCKRSDYILIPYKNVLQSSGVIAYASYYNTPVIGPSEGLLGKLVRKYKLGITIKDLDSNKLTVFFENVKKYQMDISNEYLINNSVENFQKIIFTENI